MTGFKTRRYEGGFFKPVNTNTGEKIQHRNIQIKLTCWILKKNVGFWTGYWAGLKTPQVKPTVFV